MRLFWRSLCLIVTIVLIYLLISHDGKKVEVESLVQDAADSQSDGAELWVIFTRTKENRPLYRAKFKRMLTSLYERSSVDVKLCVVTDSMSREVAKRVVAETESAVKKPIRVEYHDIHVVANSMEELIGNLVRYFSSRPGAYYSSTLFFLSVGLHRFALRSSKVLMMDVDLDIRSDVKELIGEFDNFTESQVLGACPELTPVYQHVLYRYRMENKDTTFGSPLPKGFPGVNSGVLLLHLDRMRSSAEYQELLKDSTLKNLTERFSFKGHLGDQDFYTLLGLGAPQLLHLLDCGWNRQLCSWWRDHGYRDTFKDFAFCPHPVKIYHGNCNTEIPST